MLFTFTVVGINYGQTVTREYVLGSVTKGKRWSDLNISPNSLGCDFILSICTSLL